jgi:prolyl-tRNA editing enzyme YbaK/EbsC (Cys-tRNA(Pro) deacylase)
MSLQSVREFLAKKAPDLSVIELDATTATVAQAAAAHAVDPGRIAKTLSVVVSDRLILIVTSGEARLDNRKVRAAFGGKPRMLAPEAVLGATGHPPGGVCPFGLSAPLPIYCDITLQAFDEVVPAAGSTNSAVRLSPARLVEITDAEWVDVCQIPEPPAL